MVYLPDQYFASALAQLVPYITIEKIEKFNTLCSQGLVVKPICLIVTLFETEPVHSEKKHCHLQLKIYKAATPIKGSISCQV